MALLQAGQMGGFNADGGSAGRALVAMDFGVSPLRTGGSATGLSATGACVGFLCR